MQTSYLHVIPDDDIAKTDRPVQITDANTLITVGWLRIQQRNAAF